MIFFSNNNVDIFCRQEFGLYGASHVVRPADDPG